MFRVGGLYDPSQTAIVLPQDAQRLAHLRRGVAASVRQRGIRGVQVRSSGFGNDG